MIVKDYLKVTIEDTYTIATVEVKDPNPHISEVVNACRAVVMALGYSQENVDEYIPYAEG